MPPTVLRTQIKKAIDALPADRLSSVADFVAFVNRPDLRERVKKSEAEFKAGKGKNWRKVRDDV